MAAYPEMVRDIASLTEEAAALSARTLAHIAPEKRPEFERRVGTVQGLVEVLDDVNTGQGRGITLSLTDQINKAISLGTKHGGYAFNHFRPMWQYLRNRCEVLGRRFDLFNSWKEEDLKPVLWWMAECGELTDLNLLSHIKQHIPESSKSTFPLIDYAMEQVSERATRSINDVCNFFNLEQTELFPGDLSGNLRRGLISVDKSYLVENLQGIKQVIEKGHNQPDVTEFIEFKLKRLSDANPTPTVNRQVRNVVDQFLHAVDVDLELDIADTKDTLSAEAFAVAQIKDHRSDDLFFIGEKYTVQAGLQHTPPEGFEVQALEVPEGEGPLEFDIIVYAEDMKIEPDWKQTYVFNRAAESPLAEFYLTPMEPGEKVIRVEFLYQLHWLATLRFQVTVAEHQL